MQEREDRGRGREGGKERSRGGGRRGDYSIRTEKEGKRKRGKNMREGEESTNNRLH